MTVGCCRICLLMINTLFIHDQRSSALINNLTRMLKASLLWWEDSALSYPTSRAAVTPAHASYPRHSSSAVVFGAAETCRNIRDLWSGAWRKGCPAPRSRPEGVQANLPTSRTHVDPNDADRAPACICRSRPSDNSPVSCVLGSVPAGISVPTPSFTQHGTTDEARHGRT